MLNSKALAGLSVEQELKELEAVFGKTLPRKAISDQSKAYPKGVVKLKRSFNMGPYKFWRVIAPASHPNYQSDLSVDGLKEWGIL
jgi:hypothetical protein